MKPILGPLALCVALLTQALPALAAFPEFRAKDLSRVQAQSNLTFP